MGLSESEVKAELLAALEECLQFICYANFQLDPHWEPERDKAYAMARAAIDKANKNA